MSPAACHLADWSTTPAACQAFRKGFADANDTRVSLAEINAFCPTLLVAGENEAKHRRQSGLARSGRTGR